MTTREFAKTLVGLDEDEIYRQTIQFVHARESGYGVNKGPRAEHRRYAQSHGFFWMACPLCGEWYGGHEKDGGLLMENKCQGLGVCYGCREEADRLNAKYPLGIEKLE